MNESRLQARQVLLSCNAVARCQLACASHACAARSAGLHGELSSQLCAAGGLAGFSAEQVEEVRMVVRLLPVFFATILFWTIYAQARLHGCMLRCLWAGLSCVWLSWLACCSS